MPRLALIVIALALACTPPPRPEPAPPPPTPLESLHALIDATYRAAESGDADRFERLLTEDALVFGVGPSDTWSGRATIITRARQAFLPMGFSGDRLEVSASKPVIAFNPGGQSAWLFDFPKVVTTHEGKTAQWLPRVTAFAINEQDGWKLDGLHISLAVADQLLTAPDATRRLLAPLDVPNERSKDADQLVGVVRRSIDDYAVKVERTSERPEFLQLGTSAAEVFVGGKTFKDLLKPQLSAVKKAGYAWRIDGNLRVKLAPDGKSGWAAAIVVQKSGTGKKVVTYPPFRFFWTLIEENQLWNLSSEHQSLAVNETYREPASDEELAAWKSSLAQASRALAVPDAGTSPAEVRTPADAGTIGAW